MHAADQSRVVRLVVDRMQLHVEAVGFQSDGGATDGKLADPALAQAAADHDALGVFPSFESQETTDDLGELLRELLDGALDDSGGFRVPLREHLVELLLADFLGGRRAEGILAGLAHPLAPIIQDRYERAPAGTIADKPFGAAQLRVVGVDCYQAQLLSAVRQQWRGKLLARGIGHALPNGGARLLFPVALQMKRGKLPPMKKRMLACAGVGALGMLLAAQARSPQTHRLEATPATVAYGYYWSEAKPVLAIQSGDIIDVDTLLTNTPAGLAKGGVPDQKIQASLKAIVDEVTGDRKGPGGHILTGPVYVEGAEPGDVLEVKILSILLPIDYGYNGCKGFLPENCEPDTPIKILNLDRSRMTAEFAPGIVLPLHPFFGSMGVAPAPELGRLSSNPPGRHAGNLDNRELVAGTTLYIPIFARGALFEIGDGHAAQGDGEVDQTAIETSLRGRLQLTVRKDMKLTWPRAETPTDYISMATDPDLTVATKTAIQEMIDFVAAQRKLTKHQAYQLVSLAGNVAVTQLVDKPNYGVHVRMPKSIFVAK